MDKLQALQNFWSSFGLPAYDATTVPDEAVMPYITYDVSTAALDEPVIMTGSLWYRTTSWEDISNKAQEIAEHIATSLPIKVEDGYLWIVRGNPFSQRMSDTDDMVRRILINIQAEYLTAF